jgi:ferrous iron transport protein B
MATLTTIWKKSGSWKWAVAQLIGLTLLAYLLTFVVYQVGTALGIG